MEIQYDRDKGEIKIIYEGREYTQAEIIEHISENGHRREQASFAVCHEVWGECMRISERIEEVFREKEAIKSGRKHY